MSDITRNHETIHFQQYIEMMIVGFLFIYIFDYLKGKIKYGNGEIAYLHTRAEQEAYMHGHDLEYLATRKRWEWLKKYEV